MRIQLIEHDPEDFSHTNVSSWAAAKGFQIKQTFVCNGENLPDLDSFDWLMIMGGSQHAWDEDAHPWLVEEKNFIKDAIAAGKIVLGICFGAQLLAEALGGALFSNTRKEIGWYPVALTPEGRKSFLFQNIPPTFTTFHWHSDHFSLPTACTRLANSKISENQAFVCAGRPLIGLQFHPEYTREMVTYFARKHSQDWILDAYVSTKEEVLAQTEKIADTYWLMESLLNNIVQKFANNT